MAPSLIELDGVKKHFPVSKGLLLARTIGWVKAVDGISLSVEPGRTLSLVGESGCGKSTVIKLILAVEKPTAGRVLFEGQDLQGLTGGELKRYRASVQAVFQDPWGSLNPRMRVDAIIGEPLYVNDAMDGAALTERVEELLVHVGLKPQHARLFPHEFSGGQRQRIAVARALALNPHLVVLDEPVSALDVSIRAQIINLLKDLQDEHQLSYVLVAHHLATVWTVSDEVAVMYLGQVVEHAAVDELRTHPLHPYTQALMSAALPAHPRDSREDVILPGEVPSPIDPPAGCRFHTRCPQAMPKCSESVPALREMSPGHWASCHLY